VVFRYQRETEKIVDRTEVDLPQIHVKESIQLWGIA